MLALPFGARPHHTAWSPEVGLGGGLGSERGLGGRLGLLRWLEGTLGRLFIACLSVVYNRKVIRH